MNSGEKRKNVFLASFANLKWYEWGLFAAMIVIGGYYAFTDSTHPGWYLAVNYIGAIAGVCCIFLCAHASWANWLFAVVNTVLYLAVLFYNRVYGTMALELLYYMPTNVLGLLFWKKHLDERERDKCKTRVMSWPKRLLMAALVLAGTVLYHFILVKAGGATAWLDAMIVAIGIIATYYEIMRYADQYLLWILTDVIAVVQWALIADPIMITKKTIYLIMACIGFVNWRTMQRERNAENV